MLDQDLDARLTTERELLRDELSEARDLDGRLRRGPGRRPDGVLVRTNGQSEAVEVEVELTPKRDRTEYDSKLGWFVPSSTLRDRLERIGRQLRMDGVIRLASLPPGLDYVPSIEADRRRPVLVPAAGNTRAPRSSRRVG
jgi:hypothetical protein